jgi:hypothetical protein
MTYLGESVICAVNGSGLASMEIDASGAPSFAYHYDPLIFAHRTITTLVPRQGGCMVHLYFNALLNNVLPRELTIRGISLVSYIPAQENYVFLIPPFQRRNPEWEAVGFTALSADEFAFEWKYTDATETRFAYTRFRAETREERDDTRESYLLSLGVPALTGPEVPAVLAPFFAACLAGIHAPQERATVHFAIRSRDSPVRRFFRSENGGDSLVFVPVFEDAGIRIALLPGGRALRASSDGRSVARALPALPESCRYTDILLKGKFLIVSWEETAFTDVGCAGLLLTPAEP